MKFNTYEYPAVKLLLVLLLAIACGLFANINVQSSLIFAGLLIVLAVALSFLKFSAIAYCFLVFSAGLILSIEINSVNIKAPNKVIPEMRALVEGEIIKILKTDSKFTRIILKGKIDFQALEPIDNISIIMTIVNPSKLQFLIEPGSVISVRCRARLPRNALLPTDFSEQNYYSSLDAQFSAVALSQDVALIEPADGFLTMRERIGGRVKSITERLYDEHTRGIVNALITGDKTGISKETREAFSASGTAHALALSGLHIGIIALLLFTLLDFFENIWLKFALFCILLATFVFLTGAQPSTIRAAGMASAFLLVRALQRKTNLLNIAAFVIVLAIVLNPPILLSAGFQMSCGAIFGIAILFEPFKSFLSRCGFNKSLFSEWVGASIALTLSAAIIVAPLVAYYFGIYSFASPIANIFVIPLLSAALIMSVFSVLFSLVNFWLASAYAATAEFLIALACKINDFFADLPLSHYQGDAALLLSLLFSASIVYIFTARNSKLAIFRTAISSIVIVLSLIIAEKQDNSSIMIVPKETVVTAVLPEQDGKRVLLVFDRYNSVYPKVDYDIEKFIRKQSAKVLIGVGGNCGLTILDRLRHNTEINAIELDIPIQRRLQSIMGLEKQFPQIIESEIIYVK